MLNPKGSPVPSVLSLSSTSAIAGPADAATAAAAAINDAPMLMLDPMSLPQGFSSDMHRTRPFFAMAGRPTTQKRKCPCKMDGSSETRREFHSKTLPRTGDEIPFNPLLATLARTSDVAGLLAVMVAIFLQSEKYGSSMQE